MGRMTGHETNQRRKERKRNKKGKAPLESTSFMQEQDVASMEAIFEPRHTRKVTYSFELYQDNDLLAQLKTDSKDNFKQGRAKLISAYGLEKDGDPRKTEKSGSIKEQDYMSEQDSSLIMTTTTKKQFCKP